MHCSVSQFGRSIQFQTCRRSTYAVTCVARARSLSLRFSACSGRGSPQYHVHSAMSQFAPMRVVTRVYGLSVWPRALRDNPVCTDNHTVHSVACSMCNACRLAMQWPTHYAMLSGSLCNENAGRHYFGNVEKRVYRSHLSKLLIPFAFIQIDMERWWVRATIALSCIGFLIVLVFLSKFPGALHRPSLSSSEMSYLLRSPVPLFLSAVSIITLTCACALSSSQLSYLLRSPVPLILFFFLDLAFLRCLIHCAHRCLPCYTGWLTRCIAGTGGMPLALTANDYDPAAIARASGKGATLSSDVATAKGHALTAPPTAVPNTSEPTTDGPTTDEPPTAEPTSANETSTDVPIVGRTIFWLTSVVYRFHGSSALQTLVRSSPAAATPCSMKYKLEPVWQCEPNKVLIDNRTLRISTDLWTMSDWKRTSRVTSLKKQGVLRQYKSLPLGARIEFLANYWGNISHKDVVFCKFCQLEQYYNTRIPIPTSWQAAGVTSVKPVFFIQWLPLCMSMLSSHGLRKMKSKKQADALVLEELKRLEDKKLFIEKLERDSVGFLVVGYDLMLWRTQAMADRAVKWLPELQTLDPFYTAPESSSKGHTSIVEYGKRYSPRGSCGYDLARRSCDFEWLKQHTRASLDASIIQRFQEISNFLISLEQRN
jgi:hypothetical protein